MDKKTAFSNLLLDVEFQRLNRALKKVTMFDILGVENKELPFTRLLTWLLNPHADHQMGAFPLRSFLRHCLKARQMADDVINAMLLEELNFAEVSVSSEYQIDSPTENRTENQTGSRGRLPFARHLRMRSSYASSACCVP